MARLECHKPDTTENKTAIVNTLVVMKIMCMRRYSQRAAALKSRQCIQELHAPPGAYGHAAYDFTGAGGGHSVLSSSDYIFRDGAGQFSGPALPADLYKSPSSNDYAYIQDANPPMTGVCRHGQQSDISRPESATPYSSLERSETDRVGQQQPQTQQQQQQLLQLQRTPPPPPGVLWGRQKSTPSGDCFDPTSRRLLMYHNKRSNDDAALPVTFA